MHNHNLPLVIGMLTLTVSAPFVALYGVSMLKHHKTSTHIRIQKTLFWACITALFAFELKIRMSGGSGSLIVSNPYTATTYFKVLLIGHIIGAIATYILWGITIFLSSSKYKRKQLPGPFSRTHKKMGIATIVGLFYTAVTALIVCLLAYFL